VSVSAPANAQTATLIGLGCAAAASVAFSLNDVGIKLLSGDYPLHQIVLLRALFAMAITLGIMMPLDGGFQNLKTRRPIMHLARGLMVVFANMMFFLGLAALPLSEATAIFFVSPLIITAFSVIFLSEVVGLRRWMAVAVGLVGAIIMLRPGTEAFQLASLAPLLAAFGYAGLHTLTRSIRATERASTMAFYIQVVFIAVSLGMGLAFGDGRFGDTGYPSLDFLLRAWVWPTAEDLAIMAAIGIGSAIGGFCISQAYRMCESAVVAPFEYLALVLAIIWGMTIFGERPDAIAWGGIALILGAGLYVIWRETVRQADVVTDHPVRRNG